LFLLQQKELISHCDAISNNLYSFELVVNPIFSLLWCGYSCAILLVVSRVSSASFMRLHILVRLCHMLGLNQGLFVQGVPDYHNTSLVLVSWLDIIASFLTNDNMLYNNNQVRWFQLPRKLLPLARNKTKHLEKWENFI
jgi:uncharacterized membrane protein